MSNILVCYLSIMSYCAVCRNDSLCISKKGGTGVDGWGHPQGVVHMAAARLGCEEALVGSGWANSCPGCMKGLENATLILKEVHF